MTYEEALEIAMEELYDAVLDLRYQNKGYHANIERQCNRLLTARNALHKGLEDMEVARLRAKKKQIYEDLKDAVDREWVGLTREEQGDWIWELTHKNINVWDLCDRVEAKLKEKNT